MAFRPAHSAGMATARRGISLLVAAALAAGCGNDGEPQPLRPDTQLLVEVDPDGPKGDAYARTTIECNEERLSVICQRLDAMATDAFVPPRGRGVCTQIYGGPATAKVRGKLRGRPVVGRFSLRDGCEIARWERFAWLLGDPPGIRPRVR